MNWKLHYYCLLSPTHKRAERYRAAGHHSRSVIWATLRSPGLSGGLCFVKTEVRITPSVASTYRAKVVT